MDACSAGIAVFEDIDDRAVSPNVSLGLGFMLAQDKPVPLLKEKRLLEVLSDVVSDSGPSRKGRHVTLHGQAERLDRRAVAT